MYLLIDLLSLFYDIYKMQDNYNIFKYTLLAHFICMTLGIFVLYTSMTKYLYLKNNKTTVNIYTPVIIQYFYSMRQ